MKHWFKHDSYASVPPRGSAVALRAIQADGSCCFMRSCRLLLRPHPTHLALTQEDVSQVAAWMAMTGTCTSGPPLPAACKPELLLRRSSSDHLTGVHSVAVQLGGLHWWGYRHCGTWLGPGHSPVTLQVDGLPKTSE
jgi:hypothetical protein